MTNQMKVIPVKSCRRRRRGASAAARVARVRTTVGASVWTTVFSAYGVVTRAQRLWREAGLNPIGLQDCRHTFASLMIAAGVNIKALQTFMGHASITVTLDLYGHMLPGSEDEAASLLNAYLAAAACGEHVGNT
jgi:integrase